MEMKSRCRKNIGKAIAAAGISIMPPTSMLSLNFLPSCFSWSLARLMAARVWVISFDETSIGMRMRTSPKRDARRMARSCVLKICGSARQ